MSKFVVLDHGLRSAEGHNLEYDSHLLRAAERQGWQPVLAAPRDFGDELELTPNWEMCRALDIAEIGYERMLRLHRVERKLAEAEQSSKTFAFAKRYRYQAKRWYYLRHLERVKHVYATALDKIWADCRPARGDQMCLPTAMLLDLAGLTEWAGRTPAAGEVDWHLNFHFPLVDIETWYGESTQKYGKLLLWFPQMLPDLLKVLPRERVHLYTTTENLAGQLYHFLGERFQVLPYPVNPALAAARADEAVDTLCGRLADASGARRKSLNISRAS